MSPESSHTTWHSAPSGSVLSSRLAFGSLLSGISPPAHCPVLLMPPSCCLFLFATAHSTQVSYDFWFSSTWGHASNNVCLLKTKDTSLVGERRSWLNPRPGFNSTTCLHFCLFSILLFIFLSAPQWKQDLRSPTGNWTHAPCCRSLEF